jgi:hypothetical protein
MAKVAWFVIVLVAAVAAGWPVMNQVAGTGRNDAVGQAAEVRIVDKDAEDGPISSSKPAGQEPPPMLRDPTEPGEAMRDLVAPLRLGQSGASAALAVPRMMLKGRIIGPVAPPAAILDLQGSVYVVQEDSELTFEAADSPLGGLTLRVTEINASEVRIEVLPFRKVLILR